MDPEKNEKAEDEAGDRSRNSSGCIRCHTPSAARGLQSLGYRRRAEEKLRTCEPGDVQGRRRQAEALLMGGKYPLMQKQRRGRKGIMGRTHACKPRSLNLLVDCGSNPVIWHKLERVLKHADTTKTCVRGVGGNERGG